MGTSKGYGGPGSGLVPSWIDATAPGAAAPLSGSDGAGATAATPNFVPSSISTGSLSAARANFTRFVKGGGRASLSRAMSHYVRQGTGGASGASQRMGASRAVGSQLLGVIRDIQRDGASSVLQRFDLTRLTGRPATEVFLALTEVMCPPGGRVDEAIARQAMLDTIADLAEQGVGDFGAMTADQLNEFFINFVVHTIEGRVMADLGQRAIELPDSIAAVEAIQEQLHQFVDASVRSHVGELLHEVPNATTSEEMDTLVERIYEVSFEVVAATAEDVE